MRGNKLIGILKVLQVNDIRADHLRWALIHHLESGKPLPTHNNKLNLSALAALMSIDRQLFYPGRGNKFYIAIAAEINNYLNSNGTSRQRPDIGRKNSDSTKQMIDVLSNEVLGLREELARANQIEQMALSGMHIVL